MTVWVVASLAASAVLGAAALASDHVAMRYGLARRFVWLAAALSAAIVPVIGGLSSSEVQLLPASKVHRTAALSSTVATLRVAPRASSSPTTRQRAGMLDAWVIAAWSVLSAITFMRLILALRAVRRSARTWREVRVSVGAVFVAHDQGPAVTGVVRPRIVVPQWLFEEDAETQALLLQHEVEHVRAGDTRLIFLGAVLAVVFPWNVALRWIVRRLRLAIEMDCDARVIARLGCPRRYGLALLAAGERFTAPLSFAAAMSTSPGIEARVHAIVTRRARRALRGSAWLTAVAFVAAMFLACTPWPNLRPRREPAAPPVRPIEQAAEVTSRGTVVPSIAAALATRDSVDREEMLRSMKEIRAWMSRYQGDVGSRPGINAVTFVVDSSGRYVRSAAETLTQTQLISRFGSSLLHAGDDPTAASPTAATPPDPQPWIGLGILSARVASETRIQARAGVWAPRPFYITVLHLKDSGR